MEWKKVIEKSLDRIIRRRASKRMRCGNIIATLFISQFADAMRRETGGKGMLGEKEARKKSAKKMRGKVLREVFEELAKNKSPHQIHEETGYSLEIICKLTKKFKEDEEWYRMFYPEHDDPPETKHWNDYEKYPYKVKEESWTSEDAGKNEMPTAFKEEQKLFKKAWRERKSMKVMTGEERRPPLPFKREQRLLEKAWEEGKPLETIRRRERKQVKKKKKRKHKEFIPLEMEQRLLKKAWKEKKRVRTVLEKRRNEMTEISEYLQGKIEGGKKEN